MRRFWYLFIGLGVLAADQATKALVVRSIPAGESVPVTTWFTLTHWLNPGGLFGVLNQLPGPAGFALFLVLPLAGVGFLAYLFAKATRRLDLVLLAAILGGALGNLVDRLRFGAVVDFLYFHLPRGPGWPSFNVADAVLSTGIITLLVLTLFQTRSEGSRAPDSLPHR